VKEKEANSSNVIRAAVRGRGQQSLPREGTVVAPRLSGTLSPLRQQRQLQLGRPTGQFNSIFVTDWCTPMPKKLFALRECLAGVVKKNLYRSIFYLKQNKKKKKRKKKKNCLFIFSSTLFVAFKAAKWTALFLHELYLDLFKYIFF